MGKVEVIRDMSADEYHNLDRMSASALNRARKSLAKYHYWKTHPEERKVTDAMRFGTCWHCALLEPEKWDERYGVMPKDAKQPTWNKKPENYTDAENLFAAFKEACRASGRQELDTQDAEKVKGMVDVCRDDEVISRVLYDADTELTILFEDDDTGIKCKVRIDVYNETIETAADAKSTLRADPASFAKIVYDEGYLAQAAWYRRALRLAGLPIKHFLLIAQEKDAPYLVAYYRLLDDLLDLLDGINLGILKGIATCEQNGVWPGYPKVVRDLGIPTWGEQQLRGGDYA